MSFSKIVNKHLSTDAHKKLFLFFFVSVVFFIFNLRFSGPAYISDEIGYLTKAIAFAGHPVDGASSWYGGYSVLIAPIFYLVSDPLLAWRLVILANSLMWGASFLSLYILLKNMFVEKSSSTVFFATLGCVIYPSWAVIAGYAFSSSAFTLVFLLALLALQKSEQDTRFLYIYALFSGFLLWIHPVGIAVIVASAALLFLRSLVNKKENIPTYVGVIILMTGLAFVYPVFVHPWLAQIMTPDGLEATLHYGNAENYLQRLLMPKLILNFFAQIGHLFVATFGLLILAVYGFAQRVKARGLRPTVIKITSNGNQAPAIALLSILGIILIGATIFAGPLRNNHIEYWIYTRYVEMALLPLLGMALLSKFSGKAMVFAATLAAFIGPALFLATRNTTSLFVNNQVNTLAFWPQYIFKDDYSSVLYVRWFLVGALAILIVALLLKYKKYVLVPVLVIPLVLVSLRSQRVWHSNIVDTYSSPSGLVNFIDNNYDRGQCIGFSYDEESPRRGLRNERLRVNTYYLYNYDFMRMEKDYWYENCDGPYLTYDLSGLVGAKNIQVVAREEISGFYVVIRRNQVDTLKIEKTYENFYFNATDEACVIKGCFSASASELVRLSNSGILKGGSLVSDGESGVLFYGPYYKMLPGNYKLELKGDLSGVNEAYLRVKSDAGNKKHMEYRIDKNTYTFYFSIDKEVEDLEISLSIDAETRIKIEGYRISSDGR